MAKLTNTPPPTSSPSQVPQPDDTKNDELANNDIYEMADAVFEEHLQLSLVEGFFLSYGLGSLVILNSEKVRINSIIDVGASNHSHSASNSSNRFQSLIAGNFSATTASRMNWMV